MSRARKNARAQVLALPRPLSMGASEWAVAAMALAALVAALLV